MHRYSGPVGVPCRQLSTTQVPAMTPNAHSLREMLVAVALAALTLPAFGQAPAPAEVPDDPAARSILEKADQIRFPQEGFQVDVAIATTGEGKATEERKYRVLAKGNENSIVMVIEPASERGQIMLMKGRDLWIFLPSVSQPVRLSMAQRLTGQVANGDLARANFVGDYNPRLLRTDVLDGEKHHVLELTAVDRGVAYQRVILWVRQSDSHPHKAEFYSTSGRLLKTCLYQDFEKMAGKVRPTKLVMEDALRKGEQSVLEYSAMKLRDLPDKVFTKDYLKRLE
jgi:outer membrane lipoprotein-sorting protein